MRERFSLQARLKSFSYAFAGVLELLRSQHNARIHLLATVLVFSVGCWFGIGAQQWALLFIACAMVWCAEALNTAIEFLADAVTTEPHPLIKKAKDVAAAAVLIVAVFSLAIGVVVFLPYL